MSARMIVLTICIFCFMVAGHVTSILRCFINLVIDVCVCDLHCNDGTRLIRR